MQFLKYDNYAGVKFQINIVSNMSTFTKWKRVSHVFKHIKDADTVRHSKSLYAGQMIKKIIFFDMVNVMHTQNKNARSSACLLKDDINNKNKFTTVVLSAICQHSQNGRGFPMFSNISKTQILCDIQRAYMQVK
jgi:hypothetical protein